MRKIVLMTVAVLMVGCLEAEGPAEPMPVEECPVFVLENQCDANDGLTAVPDRDGSETDGITACAGCRRIEDAFYERSTELGCCMPFPHAECPWLAEGRLSRCYAWQVDLQAAAIRSSASCEELDFRTALLDNWTGLECGGARCYAPPYTEHTPEPGTPGLDPRLACEPW